VLECFCKIAGAGVLKIGVLNQGKTSTGLATELLVNVVFQLVS
jgi:hypothetical protein